MKRRFVRSFVFVSLLLLVFALPAHAEQLTVDEISRGLWSPHFCGKTLAGDAGEDIAQVKAEIQQLIDQGQSKDQILNYYVGIYGEKILAEPPKKGFFLSAWIMPFVGFLFGSFVVYLFVGRRKSPAQSNAREIPADIPDQDIDAEMKKYL